MEGRLLNEIARFLHQLDGLQTELLALFVRKRDALKHGRAKELTQMAGEESALVERLKSQLTRREEILAMAADAGFRCETLSLLLEQIDPDNSSDLNAAMQRARDNSTELRRESWVQWIVAQRSYKQHSDLLELIANRGEKSPVYGCPRTSGERAGALLDTSA